MDLCTLEADYVMDSHYVYKCNFVKEVKTTFFQKLIDVITSWCTFGVQHLLLQVAPLVNLSYLISPYPLSLLQYTQVIPVWKGQVQFPDNSFIFSLTYKQLPTNSSLQGLLWLDVFIHRFNYFLKIA